MKILWVTSEIPYPPINGYSIRVFNFLERIAREHDVYLFTLRGEDESDQGLGPLREICKDVGFSTYASGHFWSKPTAVLPYLLRGIPIDLRFYQSSEHRRAFLNFIGDKKFDIVQIEDSFMALWLEYLPRDLQAKTILDFQDVGFRKYLRMAPLEETLRRRLRIWSYAKQLQKWEPAYAERYDLCLAMSDIDRGILLEANPNLNVEILTNGIELDQYRITPISNPTPTLLFVGNMEYTPNVDAVLYFAEKIFPDVRKQVPQVEFYIVGLDPRHSVRDLAGDGIFVTGKVPDVKPYYERSWISVVPLRAGTGIRNKILEAMALGRPTVSSKIGCEGLQVTHGEDILISDDAHEFGEYVVQLLQDENLRMRLIRNGRRNVEHNYDWSVLSKRAIALFEGLSNDHHS